MFSTTKRESWVSWECCAGTCRTCSSLLQPLMGQAHDSGRLLPRVREDFLFLPHPQSGVGTSGSDLHRILLSLWARNQTVKELCEEWSWRGWRRTVGTRILRFVKISNCIKDFFFFPEQKNSWREIIKLPIEALKYLMHWYYKILCQGTRLLPVCTMLASC